MFLHINTFGNQLSVHSKDATEAVPEIPAVEEKRNEAGDVIEAARDKVPAVPAKPAEPLKNAVKEVMDFWKKEETDPVALVNGKRLDLNKTALENGLKENDTIFIVTQKSLDEAVTTKQAELDNAKKLAGKF